MTEEAQGPSRDEVLRIGFERLMCHFLNNAEEIFLHVLKDAPDEPTALRLLGVTRWKLGHRAAALVSLRAAVAAAPERDAVWNDLAVALRDMGEATQAADARAEANRLRATQPGLAPLAPLSLLAFSSERTVHKFEVIDYPYRAAIRYGSGRPPHPELAALIGEGRERYAAFLDELGEIQPYFAQVPMGGRHEDAEPFWLNAWFPPLDAMALTQMLRRHDPRLFLEIGSGLSTKFARRAISAFGLRTRLVSIDPAPRAEVDGLCDQIIRQPLEQTDPNLFDALAAGDVLFLDSSHRAFQNSDVTVFFLEILPRLRPGVIVHVHDIYLPDDYISGHVHRQWNEQYMLAVALLFGGRSFEILFPAWYVGQDPELGQRIPTAPREPPLSDLHPYGASFWMRKL